MQLAKRLETNIIQTVSTIFNGNQNLGIAYAYERTQRYGMQRIYLHLIFYKTANISSYQRLLIRTIALHCGSLSVLNNILMLTED